jgi:Amidases related to nicotinamidase
MPLDLSWLVAPAHTALVLQEVQNGVVGSPSVLPELAAAGEAVHLIEHCAALAARAREIGVPVFHCTAETRDDLVGANRNARLFAGVQKARLRLSPGSDAVRVPELIGTDPGDVVLARHHGLGPMTGTQLDSMLRHLGITTIVGVGVSVNIGMTNFAFDAVNRGYQFVMPTDAVAGVPAEYAAAVIANTLALVATLTTTGAVLDAWAA